MSRLCAIFDFRVRDLLLDPELLGKSREVNRGKYQVVVRLPARGMSQESVADSEPSTEELAELFPGKPFPPVPGGVHVALSVSSRSSDFAKVSLLRVEVMFESSFGAADFEENAPKEASLFKQAHQALRDAFSEASAVVSGLLDWVRADGFQFWIGLTGEALIGVGEGRIVDLGAVLELPVTLPLEPYVIHQIQKTQVLEAQGLAQMFAAVENNDTPGLADSLLADSLFLAGHSEPNDLPRALLVAAIGTEIKAKETLRECAAPSQSELIELLLSSPRDWSLAAGSLFDRPMKIVAGRSMREDDKLLYKGVLDLFTRRNRMAHRGEIPTEAEAEESIDAAVGAFRWLRRNQPKAATSRSS